MNVRLNICCCLKLYILQIYLKNRFKKIKIPKLQLIVLDLIYCRIEIKRTTLLKRHLYFLLLGNQAPNDHILQSV